MNFVTHLFRVFVLKAVTRAWNFVRRHPVLTLGIFAFIFALPWLVGRFVLARKLWELWLRLQDWLSDLEGRASFAGRLLRYALLIVALLIIPGGFLLYGAAKASVALYNAKAESDGITVDVTEE